jgi:heme-degrading monooxygenase HmoA
MSVVKINAIELPEGAGPELESRFAARLGAVEGSPGFEEFCLLRPTAGESRYFVYTRWASEEAYQQWSATRSRGAHAGPPSGAPVAPVATGAALLEFDVVSRTTA